MTGNLGSMKALLALLLILLLVVVALPMAMGGMDAMGDCPMCTSPETHIALGMCAALLSLVGLAVLLTSSRLHLVRATARRFLLTSAIYKPPRFA